MREKEKGVGRSRSPWQRLPLASPDPSDGFISPPRSVTELGLHLTGRIGFWR